MSILLACYEFDWNRYVTAIIKIIYENPNTILPISPETLMLSEEIVHMQNVKYEFFEARDFYKDPIKKNLFSLYTSILYAGAKVLLIPNTLVSSRTIYNKFKIFSTMKYTKLRNPNLIEALSRIKFHLDEIIVH